MRNIVYATLIVLASGCGASQSPQMVVNPQNETDGGQPGSDPDLGHSVVADMDKPVNHPDMLSVKHDMEPDPYSPESRPVGYPCDQTADCMKYTPGAGGGTETGDTCDSGVCVRHVDQPCTSTYPSDAGTPVLYSGTQQCTQGNTGSYINSGGMVVYNYTCGACVP